MVYTMIEPKELKSKRNADAIVKAIRSYKPVARQTMVNVCINGCGEYHVVVSSDDDLITDMVYYILDDNKEIIGRVSKNWGWPVY